MRVLHVAPSFFPALRYGGPIETLLRLCRSLQHNGIDLEVATTNADGRSALDVPTDRFIDVQGVSVRYFRRNGTVDYAPSLEMARFLSGHIRGYDLVHVTSTFSFPALAAGFAARRNSVPYVVSPHGSLQRWSLGQKRWKKIPYWYAFERRHLRAAAGIHVTADLEQAEVFQAIRHPNIFVVANGQEPVPVPDVSRSASQVVFLGRIHRKKGFDVLIPAMAEVTRVFPESELVVAGPDEDGEWRRVEQLIAQASPRPKVRYLGAIYGEERFRLLTSSAVFVLSSHSENFGMTVVEAMACRTPVVVSRNCPWRSVEERGAGAWVQNTPEQVAAALLRILRDPQLRVRMGEAGAELAAEFSWPAIGRQMANQYARILDVARSGGAA